MIHFPMYFKVESKTVPGIQKNWNSTTSPSELDLTISIPPEFDGPGGGHSPEDLFALSLLNCFVATFSVFAEKSKLKFDSIDCKGILSVDLNEKGLACMKNFSLTAILKNTPDKERAERLLKKVSESCMIINSVKTTVEFIFRINPE